MADEDGFGRGRRRVKSEAQSQCGQYPTTTSSTAAPAPADQTHKPSSLIPRRTQLNCLICNQQFQYSTAFSFRNKLSVSYCEKLLGAFCGLLKIQVEDNDDVRNLDLNKLPLPFCTKCISIVMRLVKFQEELESLQKSIAITVSDFKTKMQESQASAAPNSGTELVRTYCTAIRNIRTYVVNETMSTPRQVGEGEQSFTVIADQRRISHVNFQRLSSNLIMSCDNTLLTDSGTEHMCVKVEPMDFDEVDSDDSYEHSDTPPYKTKKTRTRSPAKKHIDRPSRHRQRIDSQGSDSGDDIEEIVGLDHHDSYRDSDDSDSEMDEHEDDDSENRARTVEIREDKSKRKSKTKTGRGRPRIPVTRTKDGNFSFMDIEFYEKVVDGKAKYRCSLCPATLVRIGTMKTHIRMTHEGGNVTREFPCDLCGAVLTHPLSLDRHKRIFHSGKDRTYFRCEVCGKSLTSERSMKRHMVVMHASKDMQGMFLCDICERPFYQKKLMKTHHLTHMSEEEKIAAIQESMTDLSKPPLEIHQCFECAKTFATAVSLQTHMLIHTDSRPHVCEVCGAGFRLRAALKNHAETHKEEGERVYKYVCDQPGCGKKFGQKKQLELHLYRHFPDKPKKHKCAECGNAYITQNALNTHIRTRHTNERPFQCHVCGASFALGSKLSRHYRNVHKIEPPTTSTSKSLIAITGL